MSDPMSAVEIEDVLSSIRRLVSEDLRPSAGRGAAASGAAPAGPALILTPALRVVPEAEPRVEPVPASGPEAQPRPVNSIAIETVVASVGAALSARDEAWDAETGDVAPATEPGPGASAMETADTGASEVGDAGGSGDAAGLRVADMARAEAFVFAEADPENAAGPVEAGPDGAAEASPDLPPVHADAGWADEAAAAVIAELEQTEPGAHRFSLGDDAPEMTYDEEVLRDLVRDLIREELQGHLGERITRNIRKLVRAEIARALAAAELD